MIPLFAYPGALPPDKPAMVAVADSWGADTLNVDLLSVRARLTLPTTVGGNLEAVVDLSAIIHDRNPLQLHDEGLQIDTLTGTPAVSNFSVSSNILSVNFVTPSNPGDTVNLHIHYYAPSIANVGDNGFHSTSDIAFTFDEPQGARRWLPIHDAPSDRFQWSVSVVTPPGWIAVSNGIRRVDGTTPVATIHSVNAYLAHFAGGNFQTWDTTATTAQGTTVPIRYYARPEYEARARYDWANTPRMIQVFSRLYGDYPFPNDGYGMVEAPVMGGGGAMEHLAMSTIGSSLLSGDRKFELVYAHELSHQWFGDAVTMGNWRDIWLNEGFATFSESMYLEGIGDTSSAIEHRQAQAMSYFHDAAIASFPLTNPPDDNLFALTEYDKGAWVVQMTRRRLGDSTFFARLRQYWATNQSHPVSTADFIYSMSGGGSEASTIAFIREWTETAGHPLIRWQATATASGAHLKVEQLQTGTIFTTGFPLHFYVNGRVIVHTITQQTQEFDEAGVSADSVHLIWGDDALYELQPVYDPVVRPVRQYASITSYPNPSLGAPKVKIFLSLPGVNDGRLKLYDVLGREVYSSRLTRMGSGQRLVVPALPRLAAGVYFWKFEAGQVRAIRMIVVE